MSGVSRPLRVGIVGHGFMGFTHAHAYRSLPYYYAQPPAPVELYGVAARSEATLDKAVAAYGYPCTTTDYHALCAHPDVDAIHCCTPNALHKEVLLAALEHGKHVYMDKPLATTLEDAREMARAAKAHPECVAQMTFQYRFIPALLRAKELVEAGALGRLFSVRMAYLHAGYIDPKRPYSWRLDPDQSGEGGALFDLGAHVVDLALHLFGPIVQVLHEKETFIRERPLPGKPEEMRPVTVDDLSLLTVRFENGARGTIESSRMATGTQDEIRIEAHGAKGAIRFNMMQPNYLDYYDATRPGGDYGGERGFQAIECVARYPRPATYPGPKNTIGWERFHVHAVHEFLRCIVENRTATPGIQDGFHVQAILHAALQSSTSGTWVDVEGE